MLAQKGQRSVCQVTSAERGTLVTVVGIINAIGNHLPPVFIYPRQRRNPRFAIGSFPGSLFLLSKSGWIVSELFINVLQHIKKNTNCSKINPILLILDNHSSHCSLESINFCRENGIILLSFPPHTSHRLQPLDVAVFGPFKTFCRTSFNDFLLSNKGVAITIYDIARLTNLPFQKAFSIENITSGFRITGIYPLNSQILKKDDFAIENRLEEETTSQENIFSPSNDSQVITQPDNIENVTSSSISQNPETISVEIIRPIPRLYADKKKRKKWIF